MRAHGIKQFKSFLTSQLARVLLILTMPRPAGIGSYVHYVLRVSTQYTLQLELYTSEDRNGH